MTRTAPEITGQMEIGEALKEQGIDQVLTHSGEWKGRALAQLRHMAGIFPTITADDLRTRMHHLGDEPHHHNAYGGVFHAAAKAGLIEATDMTVKSERADAHARRLVVWRSLCLPW